MKSSLSIDQRKELLDMALKRARPGSGSDLTMVREEGSRYPLVDVRAYLGHVPFVVVGGLATRLYMPERMTLDTDVLVRPEDLQNAETELESNGCKQTNTLTIGGSTWILPDGRNLDVIAVDEPWVAEAIERKIMDHDGVPHIDLPYLALMKLTSGRLQDLADVSRMLGGASEERLDATREIVERFQAKDMEDLESLIKLGKLERERGIEPPTFSLGS